MNRNLAERGKIASSYFGEQFEIKTGKAARYIQSDSDRCNHFVAQMSTGATLLHVSVVTGSYP